jgi:hypothetical protein
MVFLSFFTPSSVRQFEATSKVFPTRVGMVRDRASKLGDQNFDRTPDDHLVSTISTGNHVQFYPTEAGRI